MSHPWTPPSAPTPRPRPPQAPTSPWVGATALLLLCLGTLVLLSYTLLDVPAQQRLGGWNYLVGTALTIGAAVPLRLWHPDPQPPAGTRG